MLFALKMVRFCGKGCTTSLRVIHSRWRCAMGTKKNKKKKKDGAGDVQTPPQAAQVSAIQASVPATTTIMEDDALREIAYSEKKKGNEEYLKKRYSTAVNHYTRGIAASAREPTLLVLLLVNRAIAFLRIKVLQCLYSSRLAHNIHYILVIRNTNLQLKIAQMQLLLTAVTYELIS
jgi:hypothetical protein